MRRSLGEFWHDEHHLVEAYFWVALLAPAYFWWSESVFFLIVVSLYANYKTAISAHEGRRGRQEAERRAQSGDDG